MPIKHDITIRIEVECGSPCQDEFFRTLLQGARLLLENFEEYHKKNSMKITIENTKKGGQTYGSRGRNCKG